MFNYSFAIKAVQLRDEMVECLKFYESICCCVPYPWANSRMVKISKNIIEFNLQFSEDKTS